MFLLLLAHDKSFETNESNTEIYLFLINLS